MIALGRQEIVGLALDDGAHGDLLGDLPELIARQADLNGIHDARLAAERAVLVQFELEPHEELLGLWRADERLRLPALADGGLHLGDIACGQAVAGADLLLIPVADGGFRVKRELEGGWFQWVGMSLPAVLTIQSGINQLRYATLKGIMAAKKKEVRKASLASPFAPAQTILGLYVPTKTKKTEILTGSAAEASKALVRKLREEARVF